MKLKVQNLGNIGIVCNYIGVQEFRDGISCPQYNVQIKYKGNQTEFLYMDYMSSYNMQSSLEDEKILELLMNTFDGVLDYKDCGCSLAEFSKSMIFPCDPSILEWLFSYYGNTYDKLKIVFSDSDMEKISDFLDETLFFN